LLKALNALTMHFRKIAPDGTQPNLNTAIMKNFDLPVPPITLQVSFANIILAHQKNKLKVAKSLGESANLFNSLTQHAFRGEL